MRVDIYNTNKKYNIIYADPPWKYWSGGNKEQKNIINVWKNKKFII